MKLIEPTTERDFLTPLPLALLGEPDGKLLLLMQGVGILTCGQLAQLTREAVEVRFGAAGVELWKLARADDRRRLFRPIPREHAHASLDWVDYVVTDPERLVFTANALLGTVCDTLRTRGQTARRMELKLELANRREVTHTLGTARPTARRDVWLRRVRSLLDRLELPEAVAGMSIQAIGTAAATAQQGDLFDRGFAGRAVREETLAHILDDRGEIVMEPDCSSHPLPERRLGWKPKRMF